MAADAVRWRFGAPARAGGRAVACVPAALLADIAASVKASGFVIKMSREPSRREPPVSAR